MIKTVYKKIIILMIDDVQIKKKHTRQPPCTRVDYIYSSTSAMVGNINTNKIYQYTHTLE